MAFSKAMPEAFRVALFNGSRDDDEIKKSILPVTRKDFVPATKKLMLVMNFSTTVTVGT